MSDEELDLAWKPNKRPQSTIAINFSIDLHDLFKIGNSISDLHAAVYAKKRAVYSQTSELRDLEKRLRAIEERLSSAGIKPGSLNNQPNIRKQQSSQNDSFDTSTTASSEKIDYEAKNSHLNTDYLLSPQIRSRYNRKNEDIQNSITTNMLPPSPATSEVLIR
ncbi:hypothetical protein OnM2_076010 [Erysiphe neolycopersici]|uniref:Uncharacterized protein n=1 Tax=Erysiphe neolycopersici TaxID=212602 RepID=A0A420HI10_9PEZI|nr:hypothetical protein OnM2_076010 [Erysiphe neolycopersici]